MQSLFFSVLPWDRERENKKKIGIKLREKKLLRKIREKKNRFWEKQINWFIKEREKSTQNKALISAYPVHSCTG
jgi:hypothetical protein